MKERLCARPTGAQPVRGRREALDFAAVHPEPREHKHLTLQLLWHEYREVHADGYSQACDLCRQWKTRRELVILQEHKAGEQLFVDYAGQTVRVDDLETGSEREA